MSAFQSSLWVTTAISACGSCISHPASLFLFESTFHQVAALLLSPLCLLQASVFLLFRAETPYDCLYSMVKYATFQCQNSDYLKLKFQILAENLDLWCLLLFCNPRIISEPEATVKPLRHQRSAQAARVAGVVVVVVTSSSATSRSPRTRSGATRAERARKPKNLGPERGRWRRVLLLPTKIWDIITRYIYIYTYNDYRSDMTRISGIWL